MDRRMFIGSVGGALVTLPLAPFAQPAAKTYRIGALGLIGRRGTFEAPLSEELGKRGYVVGRNLVFEERFADGNTDLLPVLATELVRLRVDVIVAGPVSAIRAARQTTTTIPIVMAFSGDDPVKSGLVANLAHPGGNVTGVTAQSRDFVSKFMELLRDIAPATRRIAILTNPSRSEHAELVSIMDAARPQSIQLQKVEALIPDDYEAAFAAMTKGRADALIILGDVVFTRSSGKLADLALLHRLPSIYLFSEFVRAGGLMSYGPDHLQIFSLAAEYIDKILKGANPAELAVQQPTKFELALNEKTAKALGLTIPQAMLLRANEVIR